MLTNKLKAILFFLFILLLILCQFSCTVTKVVTKDRYVALAKWTIDDERDVKNYVIQYSLNSKDGWIDVDSISNLRRNSYSIDNIEKDTGYLRLKIYTVDDSIKYSNIKKITEK